MIDRFGRYWLHAVRYLLFSPKELDEVDEATQLTRQAIAFAAALHQTRLFIETNGIGRFLPGLVRRELRGRSCNLTLVERHSTRSKAQRILQALDPILAVATSWSTSRLPRVASSRKCVSGRRIPSLAMMASTPSAVQSSSSL
ncbi:MAG: hypothetical protein R3D28_01070 [Geminicoccaceae bacterium]